MFKKQPKMSAKLTNKWELVVENDPNVQPAILEERTFAMKTMLTKHDMALAKKTKLKEDD